MTHALDEHNRRVMEAADCPLCGSGAGNPCVGVKAVHVHIDRLIAADPPECGVEQALDDLRACRAELLLAVV